MLFKALKSNSALISVSSAFSSSDSSTLSLCSSSFSSQFHANFSLFFVASDFESVIKKMMIVSCDLFLNSAQNQMFLEFEEYIEKKLHSLVLNIEINRNNISKMKKNVEDVTINCREMWKQMMIQKTWINDLLCWIAR